VGGLPIALMRSAAFHGRYAQIEGIEVRIMKAFRVKRGQKGFTLIELMIAIAIIGILVTIALPQFVTYRQRSYNTLAKTDLKNAYTLAQAYFNDNPSGVISTANLTVYGFQSSPNVIVSASGASTALLITASHVNGTVAYSINSAGLITP
jgi:prepilin-type N-terminal cleavage/methylation domain-containing protein